MGDDLAHAGLGRLLQLGRFDLQQQGTAHRGRYQLRVHEEEDSAGGGGGGGAGEDASWEESAL